MTTMASAGVAANTAALLQLLREAGLLRSAAPQLKPLSGGISSDILLVVDGDTRFVVKRALAKLRTRDDWFADSSRNRIEESYLRRVGALLPSSVPRLLAGSPRDGWFAMEYLGDSFTNWKVELLAGRAEVAHARRAGEMLGTIHRATWGDAALAREFATWRNFRQLRVEPYLETAARRVPDLGAAPLAAAARLRETALALVHGDFSPKNLLVSPERVVLLDAEVAWFGDPAFDAAFLLNHLHLKALFHALAPGAVPALVPAFWRSCTAALASHADAAFEARTVRLLLCLMLARVYGKSPVEYLTEPRTHNLVVEFVRMHLPHPVASLAELSSLWWEAVRRP